MTALRFTTEILAPEAVAPEIPALRAHYALHRCLGEGGFGRVFEAWDSRLCRRVAIKFIKHADADTTATTLLQEARLGASCSHPAFVKIHAIEDDGVSQSIVMELVLGQTLERVLAGTTVARADALSWACQIADAMDDAHQNGLVHGDLKPSNLMLEPSGTIRILDFGLAHQLDALAPTLPSPVQGTVAYMAPERILGAPPSPHADIYALGLILYELVCGNHPYALRDKSGTTPSRAPDSDDGWQYPVGTDAALSALINAMTARRSAQRPGSMAQVRASLTALRTPATAGDSARAPAGQPVWASLSRRSRKLFAGVLGALMLGVAGWSAAPYLATLGPSLAPLSSAVEMHQGLAALKLFDRPGSLELAEHHFRRILERQPDSAAAVAGMSLMYSQRYLSDRRDESWLRLADASAQRATQLDIHLALGHIARAWVLDNAGKRDQALVAYGQGLRLDPANFFGWYGQVITLRGLQRYDEARARIADAMQRFPQERVFVDELGTIEYEQADYRAAEKLFRRSIALQPDAIFAYANLNAALLRQNRGDEALHVLQQGLQVRPSAKLYGNLGNALFLRQDYVGAVAAFTNAVSPTSGAPNDYLNWANLADALKWLPGREADALRAYGKARALLAPRLAHAPADVVMVSRMGLYSARTGSAVEAGALLQQAQALAPHNADVQFRVGLAYELLGQRDTALIAIHHAVGLGYPVAFVDAEPDLVSLRRDERYRPDACRPESAACVAR